MSFFKLILFDLDDTLIHFDDYWETSAKETFCKHATTKEFDCNKMFDVYREQDKFFEDLYHKQEITIDQYRINRFIHTLAHFGKFVDEDTAVDFENLYRGISRTHMNTSSQLMDLLFKLRQQHFLGIVTNGTTSWQYDKIDALGIKSIIPAESVFISEKVGFEKPAPEIYYCAIEHFQVSPDQTLFVGDSWKNDVEGPSKLGIRSVWINKKGLPIPNKDIKPYGIISNINELNDLL
ncbi:HAD family hydrolase [Paenibacillus sp. H1-7]|uniref:HAD family hydrolase n=1 Tax=Paenibacillus sp. H1-7 TaxID=2282849 RepID=UPI001EF79B8D|nr:HAD family hydrolase [Paenibacillus sp. H1-7]ULL16376.1 HAD family hydrolase [Paenibacillus sp. H1-7]